MKYVGTGMSFGVHPKEQGRVEYLKCIFTTPHDSIVSNNSFYTIANTKTKN